MSSNPQPTPPLDLAQFDGHTPGPWHTHDGARMPVVVRSDDERTVVMCYDHDGQDEEANAALIAAAPSLLAECRRLRAREAALVAALKTHDELLEDFLGVDHGEVRADSERRANYHDLRRVAHDARDACALILGDANNA